VPTLPLNIPRREFGVYSWLTLFQSQVRGQSWLRLVTRANQPFVFRSCSLRRRMTSISLRVLMNWRKSFQTSGSSSSIWILWIITHQKTLRSLGRAGGTHRIVALERTPPAKSSFCSDFYTFKPKYFVQGLKATKCSRAAAHDIELFKPVSFGTKKGPTHKILGRS